ncbi:MAG: DUF4364 family protein [Lachnospiraceae bacterium]|nr:DUF4364 family protein [Lachnospiraceae bacterium]
MEYDAFDAGIDPGGLRKRSNVRLLICYIINSMDRPVRKDWVVTAMQKNGIANYFEILDSFNDLYKKQNLNLVDDKKELYTVTESGKMIASNLSSELPLTIRERALATVMELIYQEKNERENTVSVEKTKAGYNVKCRITGGDSDLFSFEMYVPDSKQAKIVKKNFQENAEMIYKVMIATVTNNAEFAKQTLDEIANSKKRI